MGEVAKVFEVTSVNGFHNSNDKVEVDNAEPLIGKVLQTLQALFPREDKTNGYCIPKIQE
jgi:hypothetical protein